MCDRADSDSSTAARTALHLLALRHSTTLPYLINMKLWIGLSLILALCIVPTILAASQKPLVASKRDANDLTCERTLIPSFDSFLDFPCNAQR